MSSLIELAQTDPGKARKRLNQIRNNSYQSGFVDGTIRMLTPKDVVIEVGACVGETTEKFVKQGAKVIAYEADPAAAAQLEANFGQHDNLEIKVEAASTDDGEAALYRLKAFEEHSLEMTKSSKVIDPNSDEYEALDNPIKKSDICAQIEAQLKDHDDIALLYIDANGAELDIVEMLIKKGLLAKIRMSYVYNYQRDFRPLGDRYRVLREQVESHPEWNLILNKV